MERHFDDELAALKHKLLRMGGLAEAMIAETVTALLKRDAKLLDSVYRQEEQLDRMQVEIDETCVRLIALHQPTASDLRLLLGVSRINGEIEHLGDKAVNIAEIGRKMIVEGECPTMDVIARMMDTATAMVKDSLHAFVNLDTARAREVISRDDRLDGFHDMVTTEIASTLGGSADTFMRAVSLVLIARNLERIGDHASNIAEDVIFVAEGRDVRHQPDKPSA